jgi:hypothetical protein
MIEFGGSFVYVHQRRRKGESNQGIFFVNVCHRSAMWVSDARVAYLGFRMEHLTDLETQMDDLRVERRRWKL